VNVYLFIIALSSVACYSVTVLAVRMQNMMSILLQDAAAFFATYKI